MDREKFWSHLLRLGGAFTGWSLFWQLLPHFEATLVLFIPMLQFWPVTSDFLTFFWHFELSAANFRSVQGILVLFKRILGFDPPRLEENVAWKRKKKVTMKKPDFCCSWFHSILVNNVPKYLKHSNFHQKTQFKIWFTNPPCKACKQLF